MLVYLVTDLTIVLLCGFTVCCFARVIIIRVLEHPRPVRCGCAVLAKGTG